MTGRAPNSQQLLEDLPLGAGLTTIMASAATISVLAFFGPPMWAATILVVVAAAVLAAGLAVHVGTRSAQRERNDRHRRWLADQPADEYAEFRADVERREDLLAAARGAWVRPLVAAVAVMISAVVVPYLMIGAHSPNPLVGPINTFWVAFTIALGLLCLATAIIAALHTDDPDEPVGRLADGRTEPMVTNPSGK